jgi:molybdopterin-guanine dinucleotide biosynthesis protein A
MTGVLLAGGRSRRMGIDKASAGFEFEGEPLAARVVRLLGDTCDEILVASGDGERLAWLGLPQVRDARAHRGPLSGVVAGLEAASNDLVAVVAVDMPFVNARLLRELARLRVEDDALIPMSARGAEPLHAVYARTAAGPLRDRLETGTLAIRAAVETLAVRYVQEDVWRTFDPSGAFASNLNRPSDLGPAPSLTRRSARRDRAPDRSG